MLPRTVVYTARPVLAALQTSHRRRRDAATVTPRDAQSREAPVWLVVLKIEVSDESAELIRLRALDSVASRR